MDSSVYRIFRNNRNHLESFKDDVSTFITEHIDLKLVETVNNTTFPALMNNENEELNKMLEDWDIIFQLGELYTFISMYKYDRIIATYKDTMFEFFMSDFFSKSNKELNKHKKKFTHIHIALLAIYMVKIVDYE